jgi:predicted anti-sigma-YlaC factor YlaD
MNCDRAKEILPLYAGGDLPPAEADKIGVHLQQCASCRESYEGLAKQQTLLRSLRQTSVTPAALASMRQGLFPRLAAQRLGWWLRLERLLFGEGRRPLRAPQSP